MPALKSKVINSTPFTWDNGDLFNGYLLLVMMFPSANGGVEWSEAVLNDSPMRLRVPKAIKIPIRNGYFEPDTFAWRNDTMSPPRTQYSAFYFDNTDRLISIEGNAMSFNGDEEDIVTNPFTITTFPNYVDGPEGSPSSVPTVETPTGVMDGVNALFTLSRAGNQVIVHLNDLVPMLPGFNYNLSGNALTMITPIPNAGDYFRVYIF
jgi:hypothetical protein